MREKLSRVFHQRVHPIDIFPGIGTCLPDFRCDRAGIPAELIVRPVSPNVFEQQNSHFLQDLSGDKERIRIPGSQWACTPSPTHPGSQQARIAPFGGTPTGLFRGILREVLWKNVTLRPIRERAVLHGEKPACLEPVSFKDRWLPQGLVHGRGRAEWYIADRET